MAGEQKVVIENVGRFESNGAMTDLEAGFTIKSDYRYQNLDGSFHVGLSHKANYKRGQRDSVTLFKTQVGRDHVYQVKVNSEKNTQGWNSGNAKYSAQLMTPIYDFKNQMIAMESEWTPKSWKLSAKGTNSAQKSVSAVASVAKDSEKVSGELKLTSEFQSVPSMELRSVLSKNGKSQLELETTPVKANLEVNPFGQVKTALLKLSSDKFNHESNGRYSDDQIFLKSQSTYERRPVLTLDYNQDQDTIFQIASPMIDAKLEAKPWKSAKWSMNLKKQQLNHESSAEYKNQVYSFESKTEQKNRPLLKMDLTADQQNIQSGYQVKNHKRRSVKIQHNLDQEQDMKSFNIRYFEDEREQCSLDFSGSAQGDLKNQIKASFQLNGKTQKAIRGIRSFNLRADHSHEIQRGQFEHATTGSYKLDDKEFEVQLTSNGRKESRSNCRLNGKVSFKCPRKSFAADSTLTKQGDRLAADLNVVSDYERIPSMSIQAVASKSDASSLKITSVPCKCEIVIQPFGSAKSAKWNFESEWRQMNHQTEATYRPEAYEVQIRSKTQQQNRPFFSLDLTTDSHNMNGAYQIRDQTMRSFKLNHQINRNDLSGNLRYFENDAEIYNMEVTGSCWGTLESGLKIELNANRKSQNQIFGYRSGSMRISHEHKVQRGSFEVESTAECRLDQNQVYRIKINSNGQNDRQKGSAVAKINVETPFRQYEKQSGMMKAEWNRRQPSLKLAAAGSNSQDQTFTYASFASADQDKIQGDLKIESDFECVPAMKSEYVLSKSGKSLLIIDCAPLKANLEINPFGPSKYATAKIQTARFQHDSAARMTRNMETLYLKSQSTCDRRPVLTINCDKNNDQLIFQMESRLADGQMEIRPQSAKWSLNLKKQNIQHKTEGVFDDNKIQVQSKTEQRNRPLLTFDVYADEHNFNGGYQVKNQKKRSVKIHQEIDASKIEGNMKYFEDEREVSNFDVQGSTRGSLNNQFTVKLAVDGKTQKTIYGVRSVNLRINHQHKVQRGTVRGRINRQMPGR